MRQLNKKFYEAIQTLTHPQLTPVLLGDQPRYYRALNVIEEMWNSQFGSDIRTLLSQAGIYDWGSTGTESFIDYVQYIDPFFRRGRDHGTAVMGITVYDTMNWKAIRKFQIVVHLNHDDVLNQDYGDIRIKKVIYDPSGLKEEEVLLWEEQ
ncbi:MAG: hypothetical protein WC279_13795 [Sulfurimonas sp.]|jgi:hypothetical protein|uniref:hypothetical protein n=1 Tax=Sulfurimonas sp. TaxID=2022749 RepID=UPI003564B41E